ncbi:MAG: 2-dehydropantoate 2-reductase N-terminal domain-containing protein [Acidobacteriota bacterium]
MRIAVIGAGGVGGFFGGKLARAGLDYATLLPQEHAAREHGRTPTAIS